MTAVFLFDTSPKARSHSRSSSSSSMSQPPRRPSLSATSAFFASSFTPPSSRSSSPPPPRRPLFTRRASSASACTSPSLASIPCPSPGLSGWPLASPSLVSPGLETPNGFLFMGGSGSENSLLSSRRRRSSMGSDKGKERASQDWDREDAILEEEDEDKAPSQKESREDLQAHADLSTSLAATTQAQLWDGETDKPWRPLSSRPSLARPKSYPNHDDSIPSVEGRLDRLIGGLKTSIPTSPELALFETHEDGDGNEIEGEEEMALQECECVPPAKYLPLHRTLDFKFTQHPSAFRVSSTATPRSVRIRRSSSASTKSCLCGPCLKAFSPLGTRRRRPSHGSTGSSSSAWDDDSSETGGGACLATETTTAQTSPAWSIECKTWDSFDKEGEVKIPLTVEEESADDHDDDEIQEQSGPDDDVCHKVKVRFCEGDVEEIITWSPETYNRKGPAPVAKLTMRDVLELQEIKQELGVAAASSDWDIGPGGVKVGVGVRVVFQ